MKMLKIAIFAFMAFGTSAVVADDVTVNGRTWSCTNTCNVTVYSNGNYSIADCCGGTVSTTFEP